MGLRYFATNRDFDALGKAADTRSDRLGMQKGGYYFVDMDEYMRFYLGEVDPGVMPSRAIIPKSEQVVFTPFLNNKAVGRVVICVHGFNVELFESYTWFRVLTETMKHNGSFGARIATMPEDLKGAKDGTMTAFVGFSWPSNGNVLSYMSDQREAIGSSTAFGNLVARIHKAGKPISLIGHSMGNFLACQTFKGLINEEFAPVDFANDTIRQSLLKRPEDRKSGDAGRDERLIEHYVMLAPDVERRHVIKARNDSGPADTGGGTKPKTGKNRPEDSSYIGPFYSGLEHLVRDVTNVYSRFDGALNVSDIEKRPRDMVHTVGDTMSRLSFGLMDFLERNPDQKWEKRLGSAPHPLSAPPNFSSVNATEIADRKIDHSDHIDSPALAAVIGERLGI